MNKYRDFSHRNIRSSISSIIQPLFPSSTKVRSIDFEFVHSSSIDSLSFFPSKKVDPSSTPIRRSTISNISAKQNELLKNMASLSNSETSSKLPEILKPKHLTENDYKKLIQDINEITTPKEIINRHILVENDSVDLQIPEGGTRYLHFYIKGKKPPMAVKMKKKMGKVVIYSSFTEEEPSSENYDKFSSSDYIEIRDSGNHFHHNFVYFSVKAVEATDLNINITFGKNITSLAELRRAKRGLASIQMPEDCKSPGEKTETEDPSKPTSSLKTTKPKLRFSEVNLKTLKKSGKTDDWKAKREKVIERKKQTLMRKRQRTLDFMNRHEIRKENEKIRQEELQIKLKARQVESFWLTFLYFVPSIQNIRNLVREKKIKIITHQKLIKKVVVIQRAFRAFRGQVNQNHLTLLRANDLLLLFNNNMRKPETKFLAGKIISAIQFISHAQNVFHYFAKFSKSVQRIQRFIRRYFCRKERKFEALVKMWNSTVENMAKSRSKNLEIYQGLLSIPAHLRDETLHDFFNKSIQVHRKESKVLSSSIKEFTENRVFQAALEGMFQKSDLSDFLPSSSQMKKLIESTLKSMKNRIFEQTEPRN